jgi:bifunctional enzyme CysN/CysC/sulfate adenylyltransferase subunit 1
MDKEMMRIVIVGHVDHGKSSLIGRLFYDTDCIPSERIQQMKDKSESQGKKMEFAYLMDAFEE